MISYEQRAPLVACAAGKRLLMLMENKRTNLALSADVTSANQLLALAESLGDEICMLKTHIDIIGDYTPALTQQLVEIAERKQFLIFEDRKFADIGNTVRQQYEGGLYKIAEWSDVTNAHTLPGPGIIEGLGIAAKKYQRGLILLAEMSSRGHLMDNDYMQATLTMAEQFPDLVIGFITQHALNKDPRWINLTPGIQLSAGTDKLGQQYNTPTSAIIENGTDVIIVGRGIIAADKPLEAAKQYRDSGWEAYQQRCKAGQN